jgi:hypothetical protein
MKIEALGIGLKPEHVGELFHYLAKVQFLAEQI